MTQEFVTLPREVVEQALEAMTAAMGAGPYKHRCSDAAEALRAALEQPQVVRETAPDGATHIQPQQGAFYKRVDEKWYVWSRMEDGRPHRWYISPGTVESCLKPISAATERLQNHVPDAGNMVPAGWKLVPLEPTHEMLRAGRDAHYEAEKRIQDQDAWSPGGFAKRAVRAAHVFQAMLAAAPQPPVVEQPPTADDSSEVEQPQGEQEPAAWLKTWNSVGHARTGMQRVDLTPECETWLANMFPTITPLYTHPQPKRELTKEEARRIYNEATYHASIAVFMTRMDAEHQDADDKGVSGWLQEAEDRVKHRTIDAAHEIGQAAAPQQGEQEICCKIWSVNRIDDLGKIVDSSGRLIATVYGSQADKIVACHNSYTQQRPKREPLTDEQIIRMVNQAGWDAVNLEDGFGERIRRYTEILEATHNIK